MIPRNADNGRPLESRRSAWERMVQATRQVLSFDPGTGE